MREPELTVGLGLRSSHYAEIFANPPPVSWFEALTENHLYGRPRATLRQIRADYPVVLHGVSLNIGSTDPLDRDYLSRLKDLADEIQPRWVSDHLCWTGVQGENLHDLLPLPYTEETLEHLTERIAQVQDFLGRRLVLENVSAYLSFAHSTMTEWDFLSELCRRADCDLLLDINNVFVSARNQGFDPLTYLSAIPRARVRQFHLAGHSQKGAHLIDTHDQPIGEAVWSLYAAALKHFGRVPTLIERDGNIPKLDEMLREVGRALELWEEAPDAPRALAP